MGGRTALYIGLAGCCLATACLTGYSIKAVGEPLSPTFELERTLYCGPKQGAVRVSEKDPQAESWNEIWSLDHTADADIAIVRLNYGEVPKGFITMTPAKPLKSGQAYMVHVRCSGGAFASGVFRLDRDGATLMLKNLGREEARRLAP